MLEELACVEMFSEENTTVVEADHLAELVNSGGCSSPVLERCEVMVATTIGYPNEF